MALPKKVPVEQMLKMADQLSPDELSLFRQKLDAKALSKEWEQLVTDVDKKTKRLPPLSEEEIMDEVLAAREEKKARRANQSSL